VNNVHVFGNDYGFLIYAQFIYTIASVLLPCLLKYAYNYTT
jgi:hypothetical protein